MQNKFITMMHVKSRQSNFTSDSTASSTVQDSFLLSICKITMEKYMLGVVSEPWGRAVVDP